jgi:ribosomal protein S12 methylthiotransferase accessory factor
MMNTIELRDAPYTTCETALRKFERLYDPKSGIVISLIPNDLEQGDPAVYAFGTIGYSCGSLDADPVANRQGGAAIDRQKAIAAAMGEAVERYCSAYYNREQLIFGRYDEMHADAVHPSSFCLFSQSQYSRPLFPFKRFDARTPVSWTWGYSLQQKRSVLVPAQMVYLPFTVDESREPVITYTTSTGLACGNTIEEAILSGMSEVVERDSLTCFWMNRLPLPHVDIDDHSSLFHEFRHRFALPGLQYSICDATTDLGIPVVFTLLVGQSSVGRMVNAGSSASASPERAALKSLIEAAHGRPYVRYLLQNGLTSRYNDDFSNVNGFQDHAVFYTTAPQHSSALDFVSAPRVARPLSEIPDHGTGSAAGDIRFYLSRLREHDIDVIVVDLTTPDIGAAGFTVVRIVMPGLQLLHGLHRFPFLGNSRLYRVPQALGYAAGPATESDLNPYPHPLP